MIDADLEINYSSILDKIKTNESDEIINALDKILSDHWCNTYRKMSGTKTNILEFRQLGFKFLFDFATELVDSGQAEFDQVPEDRVVAAFGKSIAVDIKRDKSRMKGFLGGPLLDEQGKSLDKGHFMGHSLGGGLDVNLFPQRPDINRGHSERGKVFRKMETYCAENPGTFCFSRPIYNNLSWKPFQIEYGVLLPDNTLWVEQFNNT